MAGRGSPHEPAQIKNSLCSQLFRGSLGLFTINPSNAAENLLLPSLLSEVQADELIADKAYDSNVIREFLASQDVVATIHPSPTGSCPSGLTGAATVPATSWRTCS